MTLLRFLVCSTVLVAIGFPPLFAQDQRPQTYTFSALSWEQPIRGLHYHDGDVWQRITITNGAKTLPVRVRLVQPVLHFYHEIPATDNTEEVSSLPAATARFPADSSEAMFLFFPGRSDEKERYSVRGLKDGLGRFPAGSYRFINFSNYPMAGAVGQESFEIPAGGEFVLPLSGAESGSVVFQYARFAEDQWEIFYRSQWAVDKERRTIVFFLENPDEPGDLSMRRIYEMIPASKDEAGQP